MFLCVFVGGFHSSIPVSHGCLSLFVVVVNMYVVFLSQFSQVVKMQVSAPAFLLLSDS